MATQCLSEYERKRIENIKRNVELLASLNIKTKLADLSALTKRHIEPTKKKVKSETPIVVRKSLRTQGKEPDSSWLEHYLSEPAKKLETLKLQIIPNKLPREVELVSLQDANACSKPDEALVSKISSVCEASQLKDGDDDKKCRVRASIELDSMKPANIAHAVPQSIWSVKFFPLADLRIVAVGDKLGNLGFWNVDSENEDGDGIYVYHPHPSPISSILIHPFSLNKFLNADVKMRRGVDVISTEQKRVVTTLKSPRVTANLGPLDPHPFNPKMLVGANRGGQVCNWSQ